MQVSGRDAIDEPVMTLIRGQAGDTRFDVVQYAEGNLAIVCNDEVVGRRQWSPHDVEACIEVYLRLREHAAAGMYADA